jgi:Flp pilus assembly protein TadG
MSRLRPGAKALDEADGVGANARRSIEGGLGGRASPISKVGPTMRVRRGTTKRRRGAAAVEVALTVPLMLLITLPGVWEMGRVTDVQQILNGAVREGGRQASTGRLTNAQVVTAVQNYLKNASIPTGHANVTVQDLTAPGTDASNATQLDQIQVSVSIPYGDVRWTNMSVVLSSSSLLTAQTTWYSMKDKDYPAPPQPPIE